MECQGKSFHLIAPGYGNVAGVAGKRKPYFARFATAPGTTTLVQAPTFFSMDRTNDVLGYAVAGGIGKIKRQP
jgi:hypothetical protein